MIDRRMRCVITIDTECSRGGWPWEMGREPIGFERMVLGRVRGKEHGARLIMEILEARRLRGDFFLEPLCTHKLGLRPLKEICGEILRRGHGVSLHLHPGWKSGLSSPPTRCSDMMHEYDVLAQVALLREGMEILGKCGVERISAFRAGNLGASTETYRALRKVGIKISSNACAGWGRENAGKFHLPPRDVEVFPADGVWEIPITSFEDFPRLRPGHLRPLQIAAAGAGELRTVLHQAMLRGKKMVVLLLHTHEWIKPDSRGRQKLNRRFLERFRSVCDWLAANRDRVQTCRFGDLEERDLRGMYEDQDPSGSHLRSSDHLGAARWLTHGVFRVLKIPMALRREPC